MLAAVAPQADVRRPVERVLAALDELVKAGPDPIDQEKPT